MLIIRVLTWQDDVHVKVYIGVVDYVFKVKKLFWVFPWRHKLPFLLWVWANVYCPFVNGSVFWLPDYKMPIKISSWVLSEAQVKLSRECVCVCVFKNSMKNILTVFNIPKIDPRSWKKFDLAVFILKISKIAEISSSKNHENYKLQPWRIAAHLLENQTSYHKHQL